MGRFPKRPREGQGWQRVYVRTLDSNSFPGDLAFLQCLSQPVMSVRRVVQKVLPPKRPQLAQITICTNMGGRF